MARWRARYSKRREVEGQNFAVISALNLFVEPPAGLVSQQAVLDHPLHKAGHVEEVEALVLRQ